MKNVTRWMPQILVVAALVLFGTLMSSSSPVSAQLGEPAPGASTVVTPPTSQEECEDLSGSWARGGQDFCRDWDGEAEWGKLLADSYGITNREECIDKGGRPVNETVPNRETVIYQWCRDFDNQDEVLADVQAFNDGIDSEGGEGSEGPERECNSGAMGWWICPLSNMLAGAVDGIYGALVTFVRIPPVSTTGDNNQIYKVWVMFRDLANIVFVLLILVALISQISNLGMSNYGIKRLLPRIIVAAVLVNISFYICLIMVDISNITGQAVYNFLESLSNSIDIESVDPEEQNWTTVVAGALSVGAVGAAGMAASGTGVVANAGLVVVPIVLMAVMAAFTAFVILAVRYILIYLLIVVSPVAFVMYLLPNTSKYFEKWKDIFITILFFYPLFSLLFGAAAIVSRLAMSQASNDNLEGIMGPIMIIFALFIQVAPLLLSYKLLQTANSVAGTVTNGLQRRGDGIISAARNRRDKGLKAGFKGGVNRMQTYGDRKGSGTINPYARAGRMLTASKKRQGRVNDERESWANQAERAVLTERGLDQEAEAANFRARAAKMGVAEINSQQQSEFVKQLGKVDDKLDANGNAIEGEKVYSPYATIAAGGTQEGIESITRQAQATQLAEERKTYTAELSGSTIPVLQTALEQAIASGNSSKAQAVQSLLYGSGGKGIETARDVISREQSRGSSANTEVLDGMRRNVLSNHGDMKSKDNAQMEWAISGDSIQSIADRPNFGANLSDKDKASQSPQNMRAMYESGNLPPQSAQSILSNENISPGLKDEQKFILGQVASGGDPSGKAYEKEVERRKAQAQSSDAPQPQPPQQNSPQPNSPQPQPPQQNSPQPNSPQPSPPQSNRPQASPPQPQPSPPQSNRPQPKPNPPKYD